MTTRLYGSTWRGAITGIAAGIAGLAVAALVAGLFRGALSPINAVGAEFIDVVPPWLKDLAIEWFGTNDKIALQVGIASVLMLLSAVSGVLAWRGRLVAGIAIVAVFGLVGVAAVLARPLGGFASVFATLIGTATSIGVLWWLTPPAAVTSPAIAEPSADDPDAAVYADNDAAVASGAVEPAYHSPLPRRTFVQGIGIVGLTSVVAGGFGRFLGQRSSVADERSRITLPESATGANAAGAGSTGGAAVSPSLLIDGGSAATQPQPVAVLGEVSGPTELGIAGVTPFVQPTSEFYRIDTALSIPQVSVDDWSLRIHGMVDNELELSYADLLDMPQIERYITLSCVSNRIGDDLVGNALFQGVRLADVLNEAGIQPGATQVASRSVDGWTCGSPTAVIMDGRDALIAVGMNGDVLPTRHGYPARLVVPGLYGYVSATKWLQEIELTRWEDFDGYWMPRGWAKLGPIKTMARIDRPVAGRRLDSNDDGSVDIGGVAWAIHRGISKVEVSIDDGEWLECELAGVPSDDTWRQWRYNWADAPTGEHTVAARAYDGHGEPQPVGPKDVAPDGAEGYHTVNFRV